jgi:hypothetical protein
MSNVLLLVRYQVLTVVNIKTMVLGSVTPYSMVYRYQNIGTYLPCYVVLPPEACIISFSQSSLTLVKNFFRLLLFYIY